MRFAKPHIRTIYSVFVKLLLVLSFCLLSLCCGLKQTKQSLSNRNQILAAGAEVNINTASAAELEKLPHIGAKTAQAIVEYRERFGEFRRPEHLLLVPRISDKKFREIRHLIGVGSGREPALQDLQQVSE